MGNRISGSSARRRSRSTSHGQRNVDLGSPTDERIQALLEQFEALHRELLQGGLLSSSPFLSFTLLQKKGVDTERLPTKEFSCPHDSRGDTCHICLETYSTGDTLKTLPCFHDFHSSCIDQWLSSEVSCPTCRFEVNTSSEENGIPNEVQT
ncbi:uncharacterized protein LOC127858229 [Dreissena polymorpha]|uniref:RING-type domain-containing protein n=1 Tax=Dreissena polymorpha TaxID=45954 RepID=A0A9D3Z0S1_DREPO|nr:uncharacterized protein LOC127858229 [Dreissena polymorpha]KAH3708535.1 hypothetical protein DPMN_067988 [Dreissena polymorpha]